MQVINGKDVIVTIDDVPVLCGKDCTFSEEKELIKASTVTSGVWREFRLRKRSWTIEVTGLTKIDLSDGQADYFTLISDAAAMTQLPFSVTFTDLDGNVKTVSGSGYMQSTSITGPANQFAEASVLIIGDGLYTVT